MGYREQPPPPALAHVVRCLWAHAPADGESASLILPDGCVDVIVRNGEATVAGPDTGPVPTLLRSGERIAGVRLAPGAAAAVLGVAADELLDARLPLAALWGEEEAGRVASASDPLAALAPRLARAAPDPRVRAAVARLVADPSATLPDLAAEANLGERHLRRRFRESVGYGPRTFGRVVRFRRALRLLRAGEAPASVAATTGYSDQAHLTREVGALAGTTPGRLRTA